jgi:hypothetical protein
MADQGTNLLAFFTAMDNQGGTIVKGNAAAAACCNRIAIVAVCMLIAFLEQRHRSSTLNSTSQTTAVRQHAPLPSPVSPRLDWPALFFVHRPWPVSS